jgi:predicted restriction endonuclease
MSDEEERRELEEGFSGGFVLDDATSFTRLMLELYDYCCAISGEEFAPTKTLPHPELDVYLFRTLEEGGELSFANAIVVKSQMLSLLDKGALFIDAHYRVVEAATEIVGTRIHRHPDRVFWPSLEAIAFHRDRVLR